MTGLLLDFQKPIFIRAKRKFAVQKVQKLNFQGGLRLGPTVL